MEIEKCLCLPFSPSLSLSVCVFVLFILLIFAQHFRQPVFHQLNSHRIFWLKQQKTVTPKRKTKQIKRNKPVNTNRRTHSANCKLCKYSPTHEIYWLHFFFSLFHSSYFFFFSNPLNIHVLNSEASAKNWTTNSKFSRRSVVHCRVESNQFVLKCACCFNIAY